MKKRGAKGRRQSTGIIVELLLLIALAGGGFYLFKNKNLREKLLKTNKK